MFFLLFHDHVNLGLIFVTHDSRFGNRETSEMLAVLNRTWMLRDRPLRHSSPIKWKTVSNFLTNVDKMVFDAPNSFEI